MHHPAGLSVLAGCARYLLDSPRIRKGIKNRADGLKTSKYLTVFQLSGKVGQQLLDPVSGDKHSEQEVSELERREGGQGSPDRFLSTATPCRQSRC